MNDTPYTLGIEEEYLLVDLETGALAEAPAKLMEACAAKLEGQVSPEFLQCQIEIGTRVCKDIGEARADLKRLRSTVSDCAAEFGLTPIAVSCHPSADWKNQHHTDKDRYNQLAKDLGGVVRRMLICGMHMHVGLPDPDLRVDLMGQLSYFLPHLLALSSSSPFWQGEDTGLSLLPADGLRQPAPHRPAAALQLLGGIRTHHRRADRARPDRGHDEDLVGPAPLAPFPDAGDAHLRCLPTAGGCPVAGRSGAMPDALSHAAEASERALAHL
jgi:hypothetical protein